MPWIARFGLAALLLAMVPVLAAACGSDNNASGGSGGASGSSTGTGGGAVTYGASACGKCVEQTACLSQLNTCAADPSCAAYLDCLDACPLGANGDADPACEKACPAVSGTAGQAAYKAFIDCRLSGVGATMCGDCGQIPAPTDPILQQMCSKSMEMNKCFICEDEHCCEGYQTCLGDQACLDLQTCIKACPGDHAAFILCEEDCYTAHPAGFPNYSRKLACIYHYCSDSDACGNNPLDPCIKCQNLHCADETVACQIDLECQHLEDCQDPCDPADVNCFKACETKFPNGVAKLKTQLDCVLKSCDIACGGT